MSRKYDLSKKSDMRRFEKDLHQAVIDKAVEAVNSGMTFDIECPHCNQPVSVPAGLSECPLCHQTIELTVQV